MKEQYFGDENDYRKYALLRVLARAGGLRIGVCWMLTPPDGRADGNKNGYLKDPGRWRHPDPQLFDFLHTVLHEGGAEKLQTIEHSNLLAGATFVNAIVPDAVLPRMRYFDDARNSLRSAQLVFFDPDNGIEVPSKPKGRKDSSKFVFLDEIAATYAAGHSVLIYQHFTRRKRAEFISEKCALLKQICVGSRAWALATPHAVFLLVGQPGHCAAIETALLDVAKWPATFLASSEPRPRKENLGCAVRGSV